MPYFDHAATTKISPQVLDMMREISVQYYGNPSSLHEPGILAKKLLNQAKNEIAASIHATRKELYFTASGTEANNLAIKGIFELHPNKQIITTKVEHHATINTIKYLSSKGAKICLIDVDNEGFINLEQLNDALKIETSLVSIIYANNEIGTIQPVKDILKLTKKHNALLHLDMIQAPLHERINLEELPVDMLSLSAHKFHGPKGIGMLYVRNGVEFESLIHGGQQEFSKRAGTENLAAIIGFSEALKLSQNQINDHNEHVERLAKHIINSLNHHQVDYILNGPPIGGQRINSIVNLAFKDIDAAILSFSLNKKGFYVSLGSACDSVNVEPSHVLKALNIPKNYLHGALRFSFSDENTFEEIDQCVLALKLIIKDN